MIQIRTLIIVFLLSLSNIAISDDLSIFDVQLKLEERGYYGSKSDLTGVIDSNMKVALFKFQRDAGLPLTGQWKGKTKRILSGPVLKLNTQEFGSFQFKDVFYEDKPDGSAVKLVKLACLEAEIDCAIKIFEEWKEAQERVKDNTEDGLFVISWNDGREKWLYKSTVILLTEYGFFVKNDNDLLYKEPKDIKGYQVFAYGPSGTYTSLKGLEKNNREIPITIGETSDNEEAFKSLVKIDSKKVAVYANKHLGETLLRKKGWYKDVRYAGRHKPIQYYIGIRKTKKDVQKILNKLDTAIRKIQSKKVREIFAKYNLDWEIPEISMD